MTNIKIHGLLGKEFGDSFSMKLGRVGEVVDAIDCNRNGFKKRVLDLERNGFYYSLIVDGEKFNKEKHIGQKKHKEVEFIPVMCGDGLWAAAAAFVVVSTVVAIALMPDLPTPPEINQSTNALEKSFIFRGTENRAAQATPVPICYGELLVGSEVIQTSLKTYPQNQETFEAFRRNALDSNTTQTKSSSQISKL